jgi:hypothetical protein
MTMLDNQLKLGLGFTLIEWVMVMRNHKKVIFLGRGALQTTGKINYLAFSKFIKDPKIMKTPDLLCN